MSNEVVLALDKRGIVCINELETPLQTCDTEFSRFTEHVNPWHNEPAETALIERLLHLTTSKGGTGNGET